MSRPSRFVERVERKKQVTEDAWGQEDEAEREKAVKTNFFNNLVWVL